MSVTKRRWKPARSSLACVSTIALVAILALATCGVARAESTTVDGTVAPIVRITIARGDVTIRTWDRSSVAVEGDPSLSIVRRATRQPLEQTPVLIPHAAQRSRVGDVALPAESFVVSTIPGGPRDAVFIKSGPETPAGPVIVTVPNDSAYVFAYARDGNLDVHDYRGGTFVGFTTHGRLALDNAGGTVFAQTARGALDVVDSTFDRVRARSLFGNIVFERCRTHQIEATSVAGSVVFDSGSFEPGLARFESARGDVAIGTQSPALLSGRIFGDGHVYTNFDRGARITGASDDAKAFVGGGGPVVTATTQGGNVYLYDGTLRSRERLPREWHAPIAVIDRTTIRRDATPRPALLAPPLQQQMRPAPISRPFTQPFETPHPLAPVPTIRAAPHRVPRHAGEQQRHAKTLEQKFPHDRDVELPRMLR